MCWNSTRIDVERPRAQLEDIGGNVLFGQRLPDQPPVFDGGLQVCTPSVPLLCFRAGWCGVVVVEHPNFTSWVVAVASLDVAQASCLDDWPFGSQVLINALVHAHVLGEA